MAGKPHATPLDPMEAASFRLLVESVTDYAIFLLDPQGVIVSWNPGAERLKSYRGQEIIGRHFSIFYPEEARERDWPATELRLALEHGRFEDEGWRLRKDRSRFWANVVITALYDADGRHRGFAKITRDLTERRSHELALAQSEERLRLLVDSVQDYAIFMLTPDGSVGTWNAGAARITGYTTRETLGKHFSLFFPPDAQARGRAPEALEIARSTGRFSEQGWRVRKDGTRYLADVTITALRGPDGELRGYADVIRDLTQQQRVEALEEAARRNTEFLAMLAHELRNPLAPIRNALGLMGATALTDPTVRWSRDVIDRQVTHISRLVEDLLDIGRLSTGKIGIRVRPLDLREVIGHAADAAVAAFQTRGQHLQISLPAEPLPVSGDSTRLFQVISNMLDNASKYSPDGSTVTITATAGPAGIELRVRDTGMGIPPDLLPRVFDLFVQAERGLARPQGGLGIGLTLVRQLVQLHGGSVEARSEGPGTGAEFVVRLPRAETPADRREDREPAPGGAVSERGRRVLIVDDNRDSAETMAQLLEAWGYRTRCAYEGRTAYQLAREWRPHAILLDLGLPEMDGYEVMQRLREGGQLQDTVVAAMTGYGSEEDKGRTRAAGFAGHLVKPVDLTELRGLLSRAHAS
jgi:PAS domain S-box-containing protein